MQETCSIHTHFIFYLVECTITCFGTKKAAEGAAVTELPWHLLQSCCSCDQIDPVKTSSQFWGDGNRIALNSVASVCAGKLGRQCEIQKKYRFTYSLFFN